MAPSVCARAKNRLHLAIDIICPYLLILGAHYLKQAIVSLPQSATIGLPQSATIGLDSLASY